jgi:hypothetical protein
MQLGDVKQARTVRYQYDPPNQWITLLKKSVSGVDSQTILADFQFCPKFMQSPIPLILRLFLKTGVKFHIRFGWDAYRIFTKFLVNIISATSRDIAALLLE